MSLWSRPHAESHSLLPLLAFLELKLLPSSQRSDDQERLGAAGHLGGQGRVRRFVRQILLAREEAEKRAALQRAVIADRAAKHRIRLLERVEHGALRHRTVDNDRDLAADARERSQVCGQFRIMTAPS